MKLLVAGLALVIAATSSSFGAPQSKKSNKARVAPEPKTWQAPVTTRGAVVQSTRRPRSPNPQWDVYRTNGAYAGSDPDPHVRAMMFRDDPNADP
jgi:hypothetical protein